MKQGIHLSEGPGHMAAVYDSVAQVSVRLDALCELLHQAGGTKVHTDAVFALLEPLRLQLDTASSSLQDML